MSEANVPSRGPTRYELEVENDALRARNTELVEALRLALATMAGIDAPPPTALMQPAINAARAVLTKAPA